MPPAPPVTTIRLPVKSDISQATREGLSSVACTRRMIPRSLWQYPATAPRVARIRVVPQRIVRNQCRGIAKPRLGLCRDAQLQRSSSVADCTCGPDPAIGPCTWSFHERQTTDLAACGFPGESGEQAPRRAPRISSRDTMGTPTVLSRQCISASRASRKSRNTATRLEFRNSSG
jgi:hypothetical protein